jgi:hypothetical protein
MGRFRRTREASRSKEADAASRWLGIIVIVLLSVGGYWLADVTLRSIWLQEHLPKELGDTLKQIGGDLWIPIFKWLPIQLPAHVLLRIGIAIFLDILAYTIFVWIWVVFNPPGPDVPEDPWSAQGRG